MGKDIVINTRQRVLHIAIGVAHDVLTKAVEAFLIGFRAFAGRLRFLRQYRSIELIPGDYRAYYLSAHANLRAVDLVSRLGASPGSDTLNLG